jgi:hypothetical protein
MSLTRNLVYSGDVCPAEFERQYSMKVGCVQDSSGISIPCGEMCATLFLVFTQR